MGTEIREIPLENGKSIFIEVDITDQDIVPATMATPSDLPPGAEPTTSLPEMAAVTMMLFQNNIEGIVLMMHNSWQNFKPDEWSVEMSIGFKGKATPIPFIAKAEAEGSIKVTATWKNSKNE